MLRDCRIPDAQGDFPVYSAREIIFGTREEFRYFQCSACGCLQIETIPEDLGRYYPDGYLPFDFRPSDDAPPSHVVDYIKSKRLDHALGARSLIGAIAMAVYGAPKTDDRWLMDLPLRSSISCSKEWGQL